MTDDLLLPTPPENLHHDDLIDHNEITDSSALSSESSLSLQLDFSPQNIHDEDFNFLCLQDMEKKLLQTELADTSMYLKNIHKGFKFARSTRSLINLVGAGLAVHSHRRKVIQDIKNSKKDPFEMDEHGNLKG